MRIAKILPSTKFSGTISRKMKNEFVFVFFFFDTPYTDKAKLLTMSEYKQG